MVSKAENKSQWRLAFTRLVTVFIFSILIMRLIQIQFLDKEDFEVIAEKQYKFEIKLPPKRGVIYDRQLRPMAMNVPAVSIVAHPSRIADRVKTARVLSDLLGNHHTHYLRKFNSSREYVYISRNASKKVGDRLAELNLPGITLQNDHARQYPKGSVASQLLGFVDIDGRGLSGIELACEHFIRGKSGRAILQRTAQETSPFERSEYPIRPAQDGKDVVLTIDYVYQRIVEKELHNALKENDADSGMVVVMNPQNGHILSLATAPSFDPNKPSQFHPSRWRIRPITDLFEPGSTFKPVILGAVINEDLKSPEDKVYCEQGKFEYVNETIHDTSPYGTLSLADVLIKSSNIGMAKTALDVDRNLLFKYARDFGFGVKSGIELRGEIEGILKPVSEWSGLTPAVLGFGHEIGVTALQMCNMFSTIANGGVLMQPTLIKEIRDGERTLSRAEEKGNPIRYVLKENTADTLKNLMEQVVLKGTGTKAAIEGMSVCGKTGTARIVSPKGGYISGKYISSFGGFFPKQDPKLCIFITLHNPKAGRYYGGDVSAPCFKRIAEQIIIHEGRDFFLGQEVFDLPVAEKTVPSFIGLGKESAQRLAHETGFMVTFKGTGNIVTAQHGPKESELILTLDTPEGRMVPQVEGLPIRNALNLLAAQQIRAVVDGTGKVVQQQPAPGQVLTDDEHVLLRCESSLDVRKILIL
jgi:cell division protein FtsI/penicillin-binding protein 2